MRQNRLVLLAGLLVVLLGVAWLSGVFERDPSTMDLPRLDIPVAEVSRVDIDGPTLSVTLVREPATGWRLDRPLATAADTTTVGRLVRDLASVRLGSLVSTNAERHGRYGVDSTGSEIVITWGDEVRRIVVASTGPDYSSNYIRVGEGTEVYATRDRINVPTDLDRLRDRTVLRLTPGLITKATVMRSDGGYSVEMTPSGWQLTDGSETLAADSISVAGWLRRFDPLMAEGFVTDLSADSVKARSSLGIELTTIDGSVRRLHLADHDDALAGVLDDSGDVYRFYATRKESLAPATSTLTKE